MSLDASFKVGDFVEIMEPQREAGKRGYILRPHLDNHDHPNGDDDHHADTTAESIFDVVIDEPRDKLLPNKRAYTLQTPARVVLVPEQGLKLVRGHKATQFISVKQYMDKAYPCLGMAASSLKVCKINPDSPHGKLVRPPAQDLPGSHSCDHSFASAEMEGLARQLYRGDFYFQWAHSFVPFDAKQKEIDSVALERAAPYVLIRALPGAIADNQDPIVRLEASAATEQFQYSFRPTAALTESQQISLAIRAFHYFIRVAGCDVPYACDFMMEGMMADYIRKAWWKENLDATIIMTDIAIQIGASDDWFCSKASILCSALAACKRFRQEAEILELLRTDFAVKLPHIEADMPLRYRQARAYFFNGDYDEAEAAVLYGLRDLFSIHGEECGLARREFAGNVTLLHMIYDRKSGLALSNSGDKIPTFMFMVLNTMFSISKLWNECDNVTVSVLKPKFRKQHVARRVVLKALQTCSVEDFREAVSSWAVDPQDFISKTSVQPGYQKVAALDYKQEAKESARSCLRGQLSQENGTLCDHPGCSREKKLLDKPIRCSRCKASFYCSRDCQVVHWKVHKQSCPKTAK